MKKLWFALCFKYNFLSFTDFFFFRYRKRHSSDNYSAFCKWSEGCKVYLLTLISYSLASLFTNELVSECLQAYVTGWHFIIWIRSTLLFSPWKKKKNNSSWNVKLLGTFDSKLALKSRSGISNSCSCSNLWGGVLAIIRGCQEVLCR